MSKTNIPQPSGNQEGVNSLRRKGSAQNVPNNQPSRNQLEVINPARERAAPNIVPSRQPSSNQLQVINPARQRAAQNVPNRQPSGNQLRGNNPKRKSSGQNIVPNRQPSGNQQGVNKPERKTSAQNVPKTRKKKLAPTTLAVDDQSDSSLEETDPIRIMKRKKKLDIPKIVITKCPKDDNDKTKPKFVCEDDLQKPKKKSMKTPKYYLPRQSTPLCKNKEFEAGCGKDGKVTTSVVWSDSDDDDTCVATCQCKCPSCPPESPYKYRHFKPKLYDFLLEDYDAVKDLLIENENKFNDNVMIRCPEYAILLDHVIAVIWYFYRDWMNWNMFNISQLEWATKFLAGICSHNTRETFRDVETMHRHLTELLFINYAEVENDTINPSSDQCAQNPPPPKPDPELPFSLKALFYRAPLFTNHLSTKRSRCRGSQKDAVALDKYANAKIQLMSDQLDKLRAFEMRYMQSLAKDTELQEIIDGIKMHADELVKAREELQNLV